MKDSENFSSKKTRKMKKRESKQKERNSRKQKNKSEEKKSSHNFSLARTWTQPPKHRIASSCRNKSRTQTRMSSLMPRVNPATRITLMSGAPWTRKDANKFSK